MAEIETMLVTYPGSSEPVVINCCDFDPEFHTSLAEAEKPAPKKRGRPRKKPEAE